MNTQLVAQDPPAALELPPGLGRSRCSALGCQGGERFAQLLHCKARVATLEQRRDDPNRSTGQRLFPIRAAAAVELVLARAEPSRRTSRAAHHRIAAATQGQSGDRTRLINDLEGKRRQFLTSRLRPRPETAGRWWHSAHSGPARATATASFVAGHWRDRPICPATTHTALRHG